MDYDYNGGDSGPTFWSHAIEFIQTLAVFFAIAAAIYFFAARPHKVSGPSMFPTFHNADYIFTDLISYKMGNPTHGDMIVFKSPKDESDDFIKRVIAIPGDKIRISNEKIYLNDKLLKEPYLHDSVTTRPNAFLQDNLDYTVPENSYIVIGDNRDHSSDSREWGPITKEKIVGKVFFRYWPINRFGFTDKTTKAPIE